MEEKNADMKSDAKSDAPFKVELKKPDLSLSIQDVAVRDKHDFRMTSLRHIEVEAHSGEQNKSNEEKRGFGALKSTSFKVESKPRLPVKIEVLNPDAFEKRTPQSKDSLYKVELKRVEAPEDPINQAQARKQQFGLKRLESDENRLSPKADASHTSYHDRNEAIFSPQSDVSQSVSVSKMFQLKHVESTKPPINKGLDPQVHDGNRTQRNLSVDQEQQTSEILKASPTTDFAMPVFQKAASASVVNYDRRWSAEKKMEELRALGLTKAASVKGLDRRSFSPHQSSHADPGAPIDELSVVSENSKDEEELAKLRALGLTKAVSTKTFSSDQKFQTSSPRKINHGYSPTSGSLGSNLFTDSVDPDRGTRRSPEEVHASNVSSCKFGNHQQAEEDRLSTNTAEQTLPVHNNILETEAIISPEESQAHIENSVTVIDEVIDSCKERNVARDDVPAAHDSPSSTDGIQLTEEATSSRALTNTEVDTVNDAKEEGEGSLSTQNIMPVRVGEVFDNTTDEMNQTVLTPKLTEAQEQVDPSQLEDSTEKKETEHAVNDEMPQSSIVNIRANPALTSEEKAALRRKRREKKGRFKGLKRFLCRWRGRKS